MSLSSQEAAASLTEVNKAHQKSAELYFYRRSSPHLIMWGIIWVLGYGYTGLIHLYANQVWWALIAVGIAGAVMIGRCHKGDDSHLGPMAWRMGALFIIIFIFVTASYAILQPTRGAQFAAYPALLTGFAYMVVGLWVGLRYVVSGAVVVALTLIGFFYIDPLFHSYAVCLWFAVVGGAAMILTGIWFRTV